MPRSCISKNLFFQSFGLQFTDQSSYVKKFFGFRASLLSLTSGKNFMVIRPVVSEILPPQMPVHRQKEQMLLTVKTAKMLKVQRIL